VREGETGASHNNYVVYSDNFGETWNLLGNRCVNGGDEAKVEELPDGTIIISSRKAYGRYFNVFTFTDIANGKGEWSTQVARVNGARR
jgi:sialidase-1